MKDQIFKHTLRLVAVATGIVAAPVLAADPLPSWNNTAPKTAITAFVTMVTREGSAFYVPPAERIAVFDNDGTLWCEQPTYVQLQFARDRLKALAPKHPEWKKKQPFKKLLTTPKEQDAALTAHELLEVIMATHAGMTTAEFEQIVKDWLATVKHPKFNRPYAECVYQPMLELLAYLRANGFKTFIVSGGGIEFMRPWTEKVYGIPPEQVIGSSGKLKYELRNAHPVLVRLPEIDFIDDGAGKPVGIQMHIGRPPLAAFGNSDGDLQMLQWTTTDSGARFGLLVQHDDEVREFAYGAASKIGTFSDALRAEAKKNGWTVVSMKNDWATIFPPAKN